jgi:hypothetical protein
VGYYNCSDIGCLEDNGLPNKENNINGKLEQLYDVLNKYDFPIKVKSELRPQQITIEIDDKKKWQRVRGSLLQLIMNQNLPNIQVLESSHSMDIIDKQNTSKLNILSICTNLAKELKISTHYLCIGDKGKWPGNDYQLLSSSTSLSVDEVSPLADSCWNFASPGIKNIQATLYYLSCFKGSLTIFVVRKPEPVL